MKRIILLTLLIPVLAHAQRYGHTSGSTFYWNKSGEAQKSDSIRYIQGSNITLTQSGNTLTIAGAAGAGSTASVRANVGWTAQGGATATDTVVTYLLWNGKYQRAMFVDTDNDSVIIAPHALYMITAKDGSTILAVIDSSGNIYSGNPTGTSVALSPTSANNPTIYFREATDFANDYFTIKYEGAENRLIFNGAENDAGNAYFQFQDNMDIGGVAGDPVSKLVLSDGGSGVVAMRAANGSTGTTSIDGTTYGIDANEAASIWNYENTAMNFATNNTIRMIVAAAGGIGVGATTEAQANRAKWNVLGRAANDTLAIWSNDGGGVVGDSAIFILGNGSIKSGANYLNVTGLHGIQSGNLLIQSGAGLSGNDYGQVVDIMGQTGGIAIVSANSKNIRLTPAAQLLIGASTKSSQAYTTINSNGTADTTFMVRNNKASGTDSTVFFTATGDIDAGGNNFYLGGHRIRSNAAGDSLIFYDGNTMIFAILSDGSTADLVAGTPPFKFFGWHRDEIIFWILTIAGLLIWIVAILAIYDKIKEIRIREHKALPGEI